MEGFDYTSVSPTVLSGDGAKFVVRYLGTSSKCLTLAEKKQLQADGIAIGLVYETTGQTFSGGERAGMIDGSNAKSAALKLGAPAGMPIYFAIDADTNEYTAVNAYLKGCQEGCSPYTAKLYGGFEVIEHAPGDGHWQTYAWSSGRVSSKAALYQYQNGAELDHDRTLNGTLEAKAGWLVTVSTPAPAPKPVPAPVEPVPSPVHPPVAGGSHNSSWTNFPGSSQFKIGHADDAVWVLGVRLAAAGFDKHLSHGAKAYAPSHTFALHDLLNVKAFQESQGWTGSNADGYPGPLTWQHLGEKSGWKVDWNG